MFMQILISSLNAIAMIILAYYAYASHQLSKILQEENKKLIMSIVASNLVTADVKGRSDLIPQYKTNLKNLNDDISLSKSS